MSRRRTLSAQVRMGTTSLIVVVGLLAVVISLIYLAHANRVATRGYAIKKLEQDRRMVVTDLEIWQQMVAEAKSMASLKASPAVQKMVWSENADFVEVKGVGK